MTRFPRVTLESMESHMLCNLLKPGMLQGVTERADRPVGQGLRGSPQGAELGLVNKGVLGIGCNLLGQKDLTSQATKEGRG